MARTRLPSRDPTSDRAVDQTVSVVTSCPGRASWVGFLRLRELVVPVKGYSAVASTREIELHQVHVGCGQRIKQQKQCPAHGPVEAQDVVKGYEHSPGQHVLLTEADLESLRSASDKTAAIEQFLEPGQVDPARFAGRSLHLLPDGSAAQRSYAVLTESLRRQQKWGLGRVVLHGHLSPMILRSAGQVLAMDMLHDPARFKDSPDTPQQPVTVAGEELALADLLIASSTRPVRWCSFQNDAPERFAALIKAKLQGRAAAPIPHEEMTLLPLRAALEQSVAKTSCAEHASQLAGRCRSASPLK